MWAGHRTQNTQGSMRRQERERERVRDRERVGRVGYGDRDRTLGEALVGRKHGVPGGTLRESTDTWGRMGAGRVSAALGVSGAEAITQL